MANVMDDLTALPTDTPDASATQSVPPQDFVDDAATNEGGTTTAAAAGEASSAAQHSSESNAVEGDVVGSGEEEFDVGMRQNAMDRDAADADSDGKLDFDEFCAFVRAREEGELTDDELRSRFEALDADGSGKVEMSEYVLWSLKEALRRSSQRVVDLFRAWDDDGSGTVEPREFHRAVRALGFEVSMADSEAVFAVLDADGSGKLEYRELNEMLRVGVGASGTRANLKRMAAKQKDTGRTAKLTRKNVDANYVAQRASALPPMTTLDASSGVSVQEQLHDILKQQQVKLIELFRDWDDDGNGALDKKEMRHALAALGYTAPKEEIDGLFESIDEGASLSLSLSLSLCVCVLVCSRVCAHTRLAVHVCVRASLVQCTDTC